MRNGGILMQKKPGYLVCSILNFTGGICFLIAAILHKEQVFSAEVPQHVQWFDQYGFCIAAACLLIAAIGFLYTYFKVSKK